MVLDVPNVEEYVQGVINLRGDVIPVIDLITRFGLSEGEGTDEDETSEEISLIDILSLEFNKGINIVADIHGRKVALSVDEVSEVMKIPHCH